MIAADRLDRQSARLFVVGADGTMRDLPRAHLGTLFDPGDLVVANDAATLPASLHGTHLQCGKTIEIRLAGWLSPSAPVRFVAIAFGSGGHRTRTEDRLPPPALSSGDRLQLGSLEANVERVLDHPRTMGCLDENCRPAGRVRGAIGFLRARLAHTASLASARDRFCNTHACRRHFFDWRSRTRLAPTLR